MPRRAFTLMELLIVVALIAVLVGIVAVTIRGVRGAAARASSLSALRQMGMGYNMYAQDSNGQLLPGYIDTALLNDPMWFEGIRISIGAGSELTDVDMQSYVWRLAPYMDDDWRAFFEDTTDAGAMAEFTADYQKITTPGGGHVPGFISERPSFGLNSIFVGGDSWHGGAASSHHPWQTTQPIKAATRLTHVVNPSSLIVFGPAAKAAASMADVYDQPGIGFCELRAPYLDHSGPVASVALDVDWGNQQWSIGADGRMTQAPTGAFGGNEGGGLPIARTAGDVLDCGKEPMPVVNLDGSTTVQPPAELADMRRWSQRKGVE